MEVCTEAEPDRLYGSFIEDIQSVTVVGHKSSLPAYNHQDEGAKKRKRNEEEEKENEKDRDRIQERLEKRNEEEKAGGAMNQPLRFIICNFWRQFETDKRTYHGGHFSPIAAYDKESDMVLIMDTASYR